MNVALIAAVRMADSVVGDLSGNCSEALYLVERGDIQGALLRLEWATEHVRSAAARIAEARAAISKAEGL